MDLDPQNAYLAVQNGIAQLSALAVSYSFSVIGAVVLVVVGYIVAGLAERAIQAGLTSIRGFDVTLAHFFSQVARYAVLILVLVMVLGQFGVQTASIIAAVGAVGLAIGLALQGTLQNIAAGIMLLILRPFRIGESIEIGQIAGTVEDIGLFASRLRTGDGVFILAPNSTLWNQPVRNYSRNRTRRTEIKFALDHDDDIDLASKILTDLAGAEKRIQAKPAPAVLVLDVGETAITVALRYWTTDGDMTGTKSEMTKQAKRSFAAKGLGATPEKAAIAETQAPEEPVKRDKPKIVRQ